MTEDCLKESPKRTKPDPAQMGESNLQKERIWGKVEPQVIA